MDSNDVLTVNFLSSLNPDVTYGVDDQAWEDANRYNFQLVVHSNRLNWEQSVEIVDWYGEDLTTCQQIWVDKNNIQK
jgi:hypothetical protein